MTPRIHWFESPASLCPQNSVSRTTRVRRRRAFYGGEADERQRLGARGKPPSFRA